MQFKNNEYIFLRQSVVSVCILDYFGVAFLGVGTVVLAPKSVLEQVTSQRFLGVYRRPALPAIVEETLARLRAGHTGKHPKC